MRRYDMRFCMINPAEQWELWRTFLAVAREGSLSGAARVLGVTQPTAGRHVDALETAVGVRLFTRSRDGLLPTKLAQTLVPHAETMAAAAAKLVRTASGEQGQARGTVRIAASEVVGTFVLPPELALLRRDHPAIEFELALSNRNDNLLRGEADIAVRMVRPMQEAIIARHVGAVRVGLFAHRSYIQLHGVPATPDQLFEHATIGIDRDEALLAGIKVGARTVSRDMFALRCDSDAAQMMALKAGLGIGGCHLVLAAQDPDLIRILPETIEFGYEMWVAMHEDLQDTHRVRLVFDHLVHALSAYVNRR